MKNEIKKEECDVNREKILLSFEDNLKVHIKLKDESWRNGYVRNINADFFIFEDPINNIEAIFFLELVKVEPYIDLNKEGVRDGEPRGNNQ